MPFNRRMDKEMWFIYTMEYYAAEKNNDIMKFAGKWMELENVILSEVHVGCGIVVNCLYSIESMCAILEKVPYPDESHLSHCCHKISYQNNLTRNVYFDLLIDDIIHRDEESCLVQLLLRWQKHEAPDHMQLGNSESKSYRHAPPQPAVGEDVEQEEHSSTVGGNADWYNHSGKHSNTRTESVQLSNIFVEFPNPDS
ncbi:hypothetical protein STEG23_011676, partial [Scotinomys teguina]